MSCSRAAATLVLLVARPAAAAYVTSRAIWPSVLPRSNVLHLAAPDVIITEAGAADLEGVLDLTMLTFFGELGSDAGFNNNRATAFQELKDEQSNSLRDIFADSSAVSFKAVLDDKVVGFVTCSGSGVLTNLAVHPKARRRSLGTRLVQRLLTSRDTVVTLEVDWDNEAAFKLYKACGFATVVEDKSGTRYKVDWWRGRVREEVFKIVMTTQ